MKLLVAILHSATQGVRFVSSVLIVLISFCSTSQVNINEALKRQCYQNENTMPLEKKNY